MIDFALAYAAKGWHVLPAHEPAGGGCTCARPCRSPGKHPRIDAGEMFGNATTDPHAIREWWTKWPTANIAIALTPSSLAVLDSDGPEGERTLIAMPGDQKPPSLWAASGSGTGFHIYYAVPAGRSARGTVRDRPGLDLRNGIVIAPPSRHASGGRYAWAPGLDQYGTCDVAPAPAWMLKQVPRPTSVPRVPVGAPLVENPDAGERMIRAAIRRLDNAPEGSRDQAMPSAAGVLVMAVEQGGIVEQDLPAAVERVALEAARAWKSPPEKEADKLMRAVEWRLANRT